MYIIYIYYRKNTFRDVFILHKQLQKILYLIDIIRKININEIFEYKNIGQSYLGIRIHTSNLCKSKLFLKSYLIHFTILEFSSRKKLTQIISIILQVINLEK